MQNNRDVNIEINTRELCGAVKGGNLAIVDRLLQNPEVLMVRMELMELPH